MRRGGGGGLYGNFVSASDNVQNKAYRGAEIPPPGSKHTFTVEPDISLTSQTFKFIQNITSFDVLLRFVSMDPKKSVPIARPQACSKA